MQHACSHHSWVWRIGFHNLPRRFLPNVFIWRNVGLLPFRAELIHPQNRFWLALALLAVICGTALQPDSKSGQMLIWRAASIFNRLINETLAVTSEQETAKETVFTVCRFGYRARTMTERIYICAGSRRALPFYFLLSPWRHWSAKRSARLWFYMQSFWGRISWMSDVTLGRRAWRRPAGFACAAKASI